MLSYKFVLNCFLGWLLSMGGLYADEDVSFEETIAPILQKNCLACHNAKKAEGALNLETLTTLLKGGESGAGVVPFHADQGVVIKRILGKEEAIMPPPDNQVGARPLSTEQIAKIQAWILKGAPARGNPKPVLDDWQKIPESLRAIFAMSVSSDGDYLAYGRGGQLILENMLGRWGQAFAPEHLKSRQVINAPHQDQIYSIAFSSDATRLATGSYEEVKIWRRREAKAVPLPAHISQHLPSRVKLIAASDNLHRWAYVSESNELYCLVAVAGATGTNSGETQDKSKLQAPAVALKGHAERIVNLAWSPSGDRLWSVDAAGWLFAWQIGNGQTSGGQTSDEQNSNGQHNEASKDKSALMTIPATAMRVSAELVSLHPWSDTELIGLQADGRVSQYSLTRAPAKDNSQTAHPDAWQWSSDNNSTIANLLNSGGEIKTMAVSADGRWAATESQQAQIKVWNLAEVKLAGELQADRYYQQAFARVQRDVTRQANKVKRLTTSVADLDKIVETEKKAVDSSVALQAAANTEMTKQNEALQKASQAVSDHEKMIADAKAAVEAATQKLNEVTQQLEPKKKALADAEQKVATSRKKIDSANQAWTAAQASQKIALAAVVQRKQWVEDENRFLQDLEAESQRTQKLGARSPALAIQFSKDNSRLWIADVTHQVQNYSTQTFDSLMPPIELPESQLVFGARAVISASVELKLLAETSQPGWELESVLSNRPDASASELSAGSLAVAEGSSRANSVIIRDRAMALAFGAGNRQLIIGSGEASRGGELSVVEFASRKLIYRLDELHSDVIQAVAVSPDGRTLATSGADKMIKLVDTRTGKLLRVLEGHSHHVLGIAWQDEGNRLASASADGTLKFWDTETGDLVRTINVGRELTSIQFVGATAQVLTSSNDRILRLHDINTGNLIRQFNNSTDSLYTAIVSPDDKYVLGAGQEGVIRIWQLADGKLITEIKP